MTKNFFRSILRFWDLIFLVFLSFFTRFFYLSYPSKVVFDETYFGLFATKYLSRQYFFDIHPPLGKMILAASAFLARLKPGFDFAIGSDYTSPQFLALRLFPAIFGFLLVILIYFLVKEMGFSRRAAFLSGFFVLFDNAILVQSRFALLDIILLFFIFLALYLFLLIKKYPPLSINWYLSNILCGLTLGIAISIKWTGFGILGIIWFLTIFNQPLFLKGKKEKLIKIVSIFFLPVLFYFLVFFLHFYLVPSPCKTDCGAVFASFKFDSEATHLFNNPPPGDVLNKFKTVHRLMLGNILTAVHFYYESDWWSWPFMLRPVPYYFQESHDGKVSSIYFLGNPLVWWLVLLGLMGYIYLITKNYFLKFRLNLPQNFYSESSLILFLGYLVYTLSFAAVERFVVIYHYLPALVFLIILFSVFFEGVLKMIFRLKLSQEEIFFKNKKANLLFCSLLVLVFLSFLYFSPLSYGFPLTKEGLQSRMWLNLWSF